jgi:uncharacterized protein
VQAAIRFAGSAFAGSRGSHAWDHTQRVFRLCERIGRAEGADMAVVRSAAFLHDIGRMAQDESAGVVCHAERGEQMARPLVKTFALSPARRENILHCIRSHRFRGGILRGRSKPGCSSMRTSWMRSAPSGWPGPSCSPARWARGFTPRDRPEETQPYSENDTGYREFRLKLSRVRERMLTAEGLRLAEERHRFMTRFFERFLEEYEGSVTGCFPL